MAAKVDSEIAPANPTPHIRFRGAAARVRESEKRDLVLGHLLDWHYLNSYVLTELLGIGDSAAEETLSRFLKANLLQLIPTTASAGRVAMLTAAGLDAAAHLLRPDHADLKVPIHPSRVRASNINHDLIAQHLALVKRSRLIELGYDANEVKIIPASKIQRSCFERGDRIPDAIVETMDSKYRFELEIQETYDRTIPRRLSRLAERILAGHTSGAWLASSNSAILDFYQNDLKTNCRYWAYSEGKKHWYPLSTTKSPYRDDVVGRIHFWLVENRRRFYRY